MTRRLETFLAVVFAMLLASCGGGSSGTSAPVASTPPTTTGSTGAGDPSASPPPSTVNNVVPLVVDGGTDGAAINEPFVSVTVCQPGTQTCRTIDHVVVDTGSFGLRLTAAAVASLALPAVTAPSGMPLGECASFASGYMWGSVHRADVRMAGESAQNVPIQVIDDATPPFNTVPAACRNQGTSIGSGQSANGILGVGFLAQDCGTPCAASAANGMYYSCAGSCTASTAPMASQVVNPVTAFAQDNNGVAIVLPPVAAGGVASLSGSLIFGVGTQADNAMGSATVFTANSAGNLTTVYKGATLAGFLDTGSNGNFFPDSTIPKCSDGFYCPSATLSLQAQLTGANGASATITFAVDPAASLAPPVTAASLGGTVSLPRTFDWGLPFFFGRSVFVAYSGAATPAGPGPFWAISPS